MTQAGEDERRRPDGFEVEGTRVSFGGETADHGCVVSSYTAVLKAVRAARPGDALQLRTSDLEVLALAVGADGHDVEARIRALLGCTHAEAKRVHRELVKRHLLRPVAMLAVGTAIVWGPAAAAAGDRPTLGDFEPTQAPVEVEHGTGPQMTGGAPLPGIPAAAPTTTLAPPSLTTPTASNATLPGEDVNETTTSVTTEASESTLTAATTAATTPASIAEPDVGIPSGETPTLIIES